jgi:uncharacterized protein with von Willebrand factor type A (vWA) domain
VTRAEAPERPGPDALLGELNPEFHGIPLDRPVVVAVLDFSASVRGAAGERVREDLRRALSLLPSGRRFTLLAFDDRMLALRPEATPADPDLKEALADFLRDLPRGGRTEMLMPLRTALAMGLAAESAQVLVVSDGAPTAEGPPIQDLLAEIADGAPGLRVDVAVHGGRRVGLLAWLTRATGGAYVALPSAR